MGAFHKRNMASYKYSTIRLGHFHVGGIIKLLTVLALLSAGNGFPNPEPEPEPYFNDGNPNWKCDGTNLFRKKSVPGSCYSYKQCQWKGIGDYDLEVLDCPMNKIYDEGMSACVDSKVLSLDFNEALCDKSKSDKQPKSTASKSSKPAQQNSEKKESQVTADHVSSKSNQKSQENPPTVEEGHSQLASLSGIDPIEPIAPISEIKPIQPISHEEFSAKRVKPFAQFKGIRAPEIFKTFNNFPPTKPPGRIMSHEPFVKPYLFAGKHRVKDWPTWH